MARARDGVVSVGSSGSGGLIPGAYDARFARVFGWYTRRLLSRRFHAVRFGASGLGLARRLDVYDGPVVLCLNHPGWWDPLVALFFGNTLLPSRSGIAPMDASQLARFRFFRKLGVFGIDPESPESLRAMVSYAGEFFRGAARPTLAITPQGRFSDVREPVRLRPGVAALAARTPRVRVACLAVEYGFWQSRLPEIFLRLEEVDPPTPVSGSTAAWHRSISRVMRANAAALAGVVVAREAAPFVDLLNRRGAAVHPLYDMVLRLRGRSGEIAARRETPAEGSV